MRADAAVATHLAGSRHQRRWQVCSVTGSKGERAYAWGWIATTHPRRFLLIRKHLRTGELAYHYCSVPTGRPVTVMTLVRVACLRWPVEEDFEFGKDHFGLDHCQVRLYTALLRHIVLTLAALAVCAVTAAQARTRAPVPILPASPDERPPEDLGLIALTVADVKRLFLLVIRRLQPETHHLHWGLVATTSPSPRSLVPPPCPSAPTNRSNMTRLKCGCRSEVSLGPPRWVAGLGWLAAVPAWLGSGPMLASGVAAAPRNAGELSWTDGDRQGFGRAHARTCGHDRQTAATRCAEVRSPERSVLPLQSGWSDTESAMWSGHTQRYAAQNLTQVCRSLRSS
jgi:hypothetical protein